MITSIVQEERRRLGNPTTDDNDLRVVNVSDESQPFTKPLGQIRHGPKSQRIPIPSSTGNPTPGNGPRIPKSLTDQHGGNTRILGEQLNSGSAQSGTTAIPLPTPVLPTRTRPTVGHQPQVTKLRSHPISTAKNLAVQQQSPTNTGPQSNQHSDLRATSGTKAVLGQSRGVGVVLQNHRHTNAMGKPLRNRRLTPRQMGSEADRAPVRADKPGNSQPHSGNLVPRRQLPDGTSDRVLERPFTTGGGRSSGVQHSSVGVHDARPHAGPTDVHADGQHCGPWSVFRRTTWMC
jgi:hypothetical protein